MRETVLPFSLLIRKRLKPLNSATFVERYKRSSFNYHEVEDIRDNATYVNV